MIATQVTEIGVYGENEIVKAVGAPLLIFLPGVLIVAAFMAVWLAFNPSKRAEGLGAISVTGGVAIVLCVSVSLPIVYILPHLHGPDFIGGFYGFDDLALLWLLSLALGVAAGLLWFWKLQTPWRHRKLLWANRNRLWPKLKDRWAALLRKLRHRHVTDSSASPPP